MKVPYTRFLSFLVNGIDKSYLYNLHAVREHLEFTFEEYVLSQMHLAIVCHLMKRDLYVVHRVYRFLEEGREVTAADVQTVLQWYYRDLSEFFRNIAQGSMLAGIKLSVSVPEPIFESLGIKAESVSFSAEKKEVLLALFESDEEDTSDDLHRKYRRYMRLRYNTVKKFYKTNALTTEQADRLTMAMVLSSFSEKDKFIRWC